jgi:hypothetical protein
MYVYHRASPVVNVSLANNNIFSMGYAIETQTFDGLSYGQIYKMYYTK